MKKIFLIFLLVVPCFLYSQEQVPETFSDGEYNHPGVSLGVGVTRENYIYNSGLARGKWGVELTGFGNMGYFSFEGAIGLNFQFKDSDIQENTIIEDPIVDISNISISYALYLNLMQGTMIQPKFGLSVGANVLSLSYLTKDKHNKVIDDNYLGIGGYISAVSKLEIFTSKNGSSIYLKGEYKLLNTNYPKPPFDLKNNFTLSLGISIF